MPRSRAHWRRPAAGRPVPYPAILGGADRPCRHRAAARSLSGHVHGSEGLLRRFCDHAVADRALSRLLGAGRGRSADAAAAEGGRRGGITATSTWRRPTSPSCSATTLIRHARPRSRPRTSAQSRPATASRASPRSLDEGAARARPATRLGRHAPAAAAAHRVGSGVALRIRSRKRTTQEETIMTEFSAFDTAIIVAMIVGYILFTAGSRCGCAAGPPISS